jgi:outer membrane biogenesis lipoprotein LolB
MRVTSLALVAALLFSACGTNAPTDKVSPSPTQPPATQIAEAEEKFQASSPPEIRAQARQAATDYIRNNIPQWQVRGVNSKDYKYNEFEVDIDLKRDADEITLPLSVQKFFPEQGESYWRVKILHSIGEELLNDELDKIGIMRMKDCPTPTPK